MRAWEINIYTNFSYILLDGKFCEEKKQKYFIYGISYKTLTGARPLHIRYNKVDGFIKTRNKIRYLVLFDDWCDKICGLNILWLQKWYCRCY